MKKIVLLSLFCFNAVTAQINIDFNTQSLPEDWETQGMFDISDAEIHPRCQQSSLIGSFFEPQSDFWLQTNSFDYNGGNITINMTFGIKDLYHSLGVSSPFQKPSLFVEFAEGNSDEWTVFSEISLDELEESAVCLEYSTIINSSELQGFETIKYRFVYESPEQTGTLYLLYWSIDRLSIEENIFDSLCSDNLGGGLEPSFVTFRINETTLEHNTYTEPTVYYHEYPALGNTTATLEAGETYQFYTFTSSEAIIGVWVDYNLNGELEENEFTELVNNMNSQNTTSFTIPETAVSGSTKMRVRSRAYGSSILATDVCSTFGSGETRDYNITITNNLGVNEIETKKSVKIYPNPSSDFIMVKSFVAVENNNIYNMMGQLVMDSVSDKIDISSLSAGTFLLETVLKNGKSEYTKIIKK